MKVLLGTDAAYDLEAAIDWYERRRVGLRVGLGERLLGAVERTIAELRTHPGIGVKRADATQLPVPGFPFVLVFEVTREAVVIVAVAHTRRRPGSWRER